MSPEQAARRVVLVACAVAALVAAGGGQRVLAAPTGVSWQGLTVGSDAGQVLADSAPSVNRYVGRLVRHAERSIGRLGVMFEGIGVIWLWFLLSAGGFLTIVAFSSVADVRMLELRRQGAAVITRYLADGTRTFFRLVRDRRTPYVARSVLAVALLYWLLPQDLIPDDQIFPGFLDDVVMAVAAAKGFMYLCPDGLIAKHAAEVDSRLHA